MLEINLTLLLILLITSLIATAIASTRLCGPTWFQRNGLCFVVLSISLATYSPDIPPNIWIAELKPYLEKTAVIFSLVGSIIAAFGEVIWNVLHKREKRVGEILKKFVNS